MIRLGAYAALAGLTLAATPPKQIHVLIISGNANGNISPCGCTKPMSGGLKRTAQAGATLGPQDRTTRIELGGIVAGKDRQQVLKAEATVEALANAGWHAIHLGEAERSLGEGAFNQLADLASGRALLGESHIVHGPFYVLGASESSFGKSQTLARIQLDVGAALRKGLAPILMLQASESRAVSVARAIRGLRLIVFQSGGEPLDRPIKIGSTWLVSPGTDGKSVLRLEAQGGYFNRYRPVRLDPSVGEHASASKIYRDYLQRIEDENLDLRIPRSETPPFAGSGACASCHSQAHEVWKTSKHAVALETLVGEGHVRDPECLPCHVDGLSSRVGFRSVTLTPKLGAVGCESCHGPSAKHTKNPTIATPLDPRKACMTCHTSSTSPGFRFDEYWAEIHH